MPARANNINAFDLKLLKALLNLKINKNYQTELTVENKRNLCKAYNVTEGIVTIGHNYLIKMWPKGKEISNKTSLATLNQLSGIFRRNYEWNIFVNDISKFRPSDIHSNVEYSRLNSSQKTRVDDAIVRFFLRYKKFEDFEKEVIWIFRSKRPLLFALN